MFQIQCLNSKVENTTSSLAKFCIEPLKKGQGVTIGNALRRVLLSDLSGIAIVGVRISNVSHEFSTIPDLKEDVIEILLNLKQIIFKGRLVEPVIAKLIFQGPGIVTAQDIELPDGLELVEPCQYITTLTGQTNLEMEVLIEAGQGYSVSEQFINRLPKGFLAVDAIFMPVRKVNFFVETSRNSSFSIIESLILEVTTDGSIQPTDAISNASAILENIFASLTIKDDTSPPAQIVIEESEVQNEFDNIL